MSSDEQLTLDIVVQVVCNQKEKKDAQAVLDVSPRTLERYLSAYKKEGPLFVKHGNFNKAPPNKTDHELKLRVQALIKEKYFDLNMTHCLEKLEAEEGITGLKRETFRKWCHEIHMVKRAKRRRAKARYARRRMQQTGLMLQMDGSPHHWFGGVPSCLIATIDDASSQIPYAEFFLSEDTLSCLSVLKKIIEKNGLFQILYVDKAGIFGGGKRSNFSQVKRALGELGIHIVFAHSPEAKGRVERLFETLQDRLIPEMRLRNIKTYPAANSYLQEQFIPNEWERKFTIAPGNFQSAYKPLPEGVDLREIFCMKEYRTVKKDHTLSWQGETYSLQSPVKFSIYRQKIEIRTYTDLTWKAFFAGKPIDLTPLPAPHQKSLQELKASA